jgi:hypothetical protein
MTSPTRYPLGRLLEHDEQSRGFQAAASPTLRTVTHPHFGPILNQGELHAQTVVATWFIQNYGVPIPPALGSCTGNSGVHTLGTRPLYQGHQYSEIDAIKLYSRATWLDQWGGNEFPPTDDGSSALGVAKALKESGEITSYTHAFGLTHTLGAVVNGPVMIGVNFYEDMFKLNKNGFMVPGGDLAGGHEMTIVGVNTKANYVTGINSWGPGWGLKGRFRMAFEHLGQLLAEDGDSMVLVR